MAESSPAATEYTGISENRAENQKKYESMKEIEMQAILDALEETDGNKTKAAEMLGMSRTTLWRRLAEK